MKIVVFGPTGMIGSRIVAELERRGHEVAGASRSTGTYRMGGDQLITNDSGQSEISAEDYASAIVDLVEAGDHVRERVGVAW